jgi:hypothetical protein
LSGRVVVATQLRVELGLTCSAGLYALLEHGSERCPRLGEQDE